MKTGPAGNRTLTATTVKESFMGVCKHMLLDRIEAARAILDTEAVPDAG